MKTIIFFLSIFILILLSKSIPNPDTQKVSLSESIESRSKSAIDRPIWSNDRHWERVVRRGGTIDPNVINKARSQAKLYLEKNGKDRLKDGGIIDWAWRGPGNVGGRIRAIALQPNGSEGENIFIGAASGGIWKSSNDGQSWSAIDDFAASLAVTSIVVDPINPDVLYAATGEGHIAATTGLPGAGIFKSIDGGTTWSQLSSTANSEFYWVNKLAINPSNSNHILAVTTWYDKDGNAINTAPGGVLKESLNAGLTWSDIVTQSPNEIFTDIEFHPANPEVRAVSGYSSLKIYNPLTQLYEEKVGSGMGMLRNDYFGRIEVAFSPSNQSVMYALQNTRFSGNETAIYKSFNGGLTWSTPVFSNQVWSTQDLGNYTNTIWVDPCNEDHIYFGGVDLWKSEDCGSTITKISDWTSYHLYNNAGQSENSQLHGDQHIIVPSLDFNCSNKKVYIGNDGGIQKTDNISTANATGFPNQTSGWDNLVGTTLGITQLYSANISPLSGKYGGGTQDNGIIIFDEYDPVSGDPKWQQPLAGDGSVVAFHPNNSSILYATTNNNRLWTSINSGSSFDPTGIHLGSPESRLIGQMTINSGNGDEVFLGGKRLWKYNRISNTADIIKDSLPSGDYISTIFSGEDGTELWIGYENGVVQYSNDTGDSWSADITNSAVPNICVTDIALKPVHSSKAEAMITFGEYTQNNVWKYVENNTGTFQLRALDFDMQVNSVTYHPTANNWVYIGTDVGVFASEDDGVTWSITPLKDGNSLDAMNNEGPVFTEISDLFWNYGSFEDGYALWAVTYGRGLWVTKDVLGLSGIVQDTIYFDPNSAITWRFGTLDKPYQFLDQDIFNRIAGTGSVIKFLGGGANPISGGIIMEDRVVIVNESGAVLFNIP